MANTHIISGSIQHFPLWKKAEQKRIPLLFDLEITARCNNKCRHCYINLPENDAVSIEKEMSLDLIKDITDQAVSLGALWCLITGGEPLLRDDFFDIYLYLKKKGLLVSVFTNATLISDRHIKLFQKYPPRNMEITVYGVTQKTYENVTRAPGSFEKFIRGFQLLKSSGIRVGLKAVAIRSNFYELKEIFEFGRSNTDTIFRFDPFISLRYDNHLSRNKEILAERLTCNEIIQLEKSDINRFNSLKKICERISENISSDEMDSHIFRCSAGMNNFVVNSFGGFRVCASLCHPDYMFDLKKYRLSEIWHDFVPKILSKKSERTEFIDKCSMCPIMNLCMWCPATAYLETGELDKPVESFCNIAHKRGALLSGCMQKTE